VARDVRKCSPRLLNRNLRDETILAGLICSRTGHSAIDAIRRNYSNEREKPTCLHRLDDRPASELWASVG